MYSDKLEELISLAIQDGELTEQWRNLIMRRAEKEGEDVDEVMLVVDSRLKKLQPQCIMRNNADSRFNYEGCEIFEGLETQLTRNLKLQSETSGKLVYTFCNPDYDSFQSRMDYLGNDMYFNEGQTINGKPCDWDMAKGLRLSINNCEFDVFDGSSPLEGTLNDGNLRLQFKVSFWEHEAKYSTFNSLPCAKLFKEVTHETKDGDVLCQYFIDCGENVKLMAVIYTMVLTKVYGLSVADIKLENFWTGKHSFALESENIDDKVKLQRILKEHGLVTLKMPYVNSMFLIRKDAVYEVEKIVSAYNAKLKNKTFVEFVFDKNERLLMFYALNDDKTKGFVANVKQQQALQKMVEYQTRISEVAQVHWKAEHNEALSETIEECAEVQAVDVVPESSEIKNVEKENVSVIEVPENVLPKVLKILDYYNKRAEKWGYEKLVYDNSTRLLTGSFKPITTAETSSNSSLWSKMKESGRNADLKEEYYKILKLCNVGK